MATLLQQRILHGGPEPIARAAAQTLAVEVAHPTTGTRPSITTAGSSIDIYDSTGTALVSGGAVTSPSAGIVNYALLAASVPATLPYGEGYRIVWTIVVEGIPYTIQRDAVLCRMVPTIALVTEDLLTIDPSLDGAWPQRQGSERWQPQIDEAIKQIHQRLWEMGRRPWLVWSQGSLRQCALHLAMSLAYGTVRTRLGDSRWSEEMVRHREMYDREWDRLRWDEDRDQDGRPDAKEAMPTVVGTAGPVSWLRWHR